MITARMHEWFADDLETQVSLLAQIYNQLRCEIQYSGICGREQQVCP